MSMMRPGDIEERAQRRRLRARFLAPAHEPIATLITLLIRSPDSIDLLRR